MTERFRVFTFIFGKFQNRDVRTGKLRKAEQVSHMCFSGIVKAGNAKPKMILFFDQEKVMIIMTAMQKKTILASGQNLRGSVEISACVIFLA
mgnify:CR=1 FL=1